MEQKANVPASETSSDSNYKFALIGTVVWFLFAFAVWLTCMIAPAHPPIKLSEHGDYLAGVAAPVAFFWLVLGYRQQSRELRQNTDALRQQEIALRFQGDELRKSVKQQIKMNKTTRLQLESDRKDRDIATAQRTLPSYQKCLKYYKSIRRPHHLYAEYIHRCEPKDLIDRLTGFADAYQQGIIQEMEDIGLHRNVHGTHYLYQYLHGVRWELKKTQNMAIEAVQTVALKHNIEPSASAGDKLTEAVHAVFKQHEDLLDKPYYENLEKLEIETEKRYHLLDSLPQPVR